MKKKQFGREIAGIRFKEYPGNCRPRIMKVRVFFGEETHSLSFHSSEPIRLPTGLWALDLHRIEVIRSVKNAVLIDKDGKTNVIIAKVDSGSLCLDSLERIPDIVVSIN